MLTDDEARGLVRMAAALAAEASREQRDADGNVIQPKDIRAFTALGRLLVQMARLEQRERPPVQEHAHVHITADPAQRAAELEEMLLAEAARRGIVIDGQVVGGDDGNGRPERIDGDGGRERSD